MNEFFTPSEIKSISRADGKVRTCYSCGLHKCVNSPRMQPYGNFKKRILNLGEAPGAVEDKTGRPFQGRAGNYLQRMYAKLGIDLFDDCLNLNACMCRTTDRDGDNRTPTNDEIANCRQAIIDAIKKHKPHIIILLGGSALFSFLGHRWQRDLGTITKWRGWTIPDRDFDAWVCPTFHPSYVMRSDVIVPQTIWRQDLQRAFTLVDTPLPVYNEPTIEYIDTLEPLTKIKDHSAVAIDFETTGLKPYAKGHRIVCAAVATSPDHVYTFMIPPTRRECKPLTDLLANPKISKMGHNIKFEDTWAAIRLRTNIDGWYWDSMQAAHILDNRPGITGLKFQTYVNFGIVDYASDITPYLQADDNKNSNAINRIYRLLTTPFGESKLLKYCALDAVYEYRLALLQQSYIQLPF